MSVSPNWPQQHAHRALMTNEPEEKAMLASRLHEQLQPEKAADWQSAAWQAADRIETPGRPAQPELVHPAVVPRRRLGTEAGRAALVHAIAHIEFNAINLALDAVYRFGSMPARFYLDWASVAADEARHFTMLASRLQQMNSHYGAMSAHNGLWEMALKTDHDRLERMALVPRVLEARGLDVTPAMIEKLEAQGDVETVRLLHIILEEEVGHVEIGSRWFRHCCDEAGLEPESTFLSLLKTHMADQIKGPLNEPARLTAGFSNHELAELNRMIG